MDFARSNQLLLEHRNNKRCDIIGVVVQARQVDKATERAKSAYRTKSALIRPSGTGDGTST